MIIKRIKPTTEDMVNYYLEVLYKTKKESHRIYIQEMIGFHLKENPYPSNSVCETLR
tara:strand:+ start:77 stop:247 length:171 start_codon:yes stop_codon:yes gene_type:complete